MGVDNAFGMGAQIMHPGGMMFAPKIRADQNIFFAVQKPAQWMCAPLARTCADGVHFDGRQDEFSDGMFVAREEIRSDVWVVSTSQVTTQV